jgi:hypothetical protein
LNGLALAGSKGTGNAGMQKKKKVERFASVLGLQSTNWLVKRPCEFKRFKEWQVSSCRRTAAAAKHHSGVKIA